MVQLIQLGSIHAELELKDIKNVHLSVHPPDGRVKISAPAHFSRKTIRAFALGKLGWIKSQQRKFREQNREPPREFLDRESHYLWGRRHLLRIESVPRDPGISKAGDQLILRALPDWNPARCAAFMEEWYRDQIRTESAPVIQRWEKRMGVKVNKLFVQIMKTKWGSCTPQRGFIRLNTELAKKPRECLQYLIVHEMTHLLEPTHNERFIAHMDRFLPNWRTHREILNRLPVRHAEWGY